MISGKRLVVNADDFGFTPDVNRGIVTAHRQGILTATTLMANGDAFEDAVRLARETPSLDIGCHLVLISGRSLVPPYAPLPASVAELLRALATRRIRAYDELAAQVRKILAAGLQPTHLDTHKHTHLAPPVLHAVARIAEEFDIRWVRRPLFGLLPAPRGCRMTDHFTGFRLTGRFHTRELVQLIRNLPDGVTEFMCHPGYCGDDLRQRAHQIKGEPRARTGGPGGAGIPRRTSRNRRAVDELPRLAILKERGAP